MKKLNFPRIGQRNLKTALAVFICMTLFQLLDRESAFFACTAAIVCMKNTVESSRQMARNRLLGTFVGGIIGVILVLLIEYSPMNKNFIPLITSIGIIISIHIFTLIEKPSAVVVSCIVITSIMCSHTGSGSVMYSISRFVDTSLGVIIAILINKYITPPITETKN